MVGADQEDHIGLLARRSVGWSAPERRIDTPSVAAEIAVPHIGAWMGRIARPGAHDWNRVKGYTLCGWVSSTHRITQSTHPNELAVMRKQCRLRPKNVVFRYPGAGIVG